MRQKWVRFVDPSTLLLLRRRLRWLCFRLWLLLNLDKILWARHNHLENLFVLFVNLRRWLVDGILWELMLLSRYWQSIRLLKSRISGLCLAYLLCLLGFFSRRDLCLWLWLFCWLVGWFLDPVKALYMMLAQWATRVEILHESDHSPVALRKEFVIIISLYILLCNLKAPHLDRIWGHVWFDSILVVWNEPLPVFKFHLKGLIIECKPSALHCLSIEHGRRCHILIQSNFDHFICGECKVWTFSQNLKLIGHLMSANLFFLKQIHNLLIIWNVEVPGPKDIVAKAMNWEIGSYCCR